MAVRIAYFVHGATKDNESRRASGWSDVGLSELGKKQSVALGEIVRDKKFHAVFCSDFRRAVETAGIAFAGFSIVKDRRLRECDYGEMEGKDSDEVDSVMLQRIEVPFPGGESYKDVEARMRDFLNDVLRKCDGKRVAIVAHRAPQLALDVLLKGKAWETAIKEDWRLNGRWKPGWEYTLNGLRGAYKKCHAPI